MKGYTWHLSDTGCLIMWARENTQKWLRKKQTTLTLFSSTVSKSGVRRGGPSPRPCFHFKSRAYATSRLAVDSQMPALPRMPHVHSSAEATRTRDPPERARRPVGATWHHCCFPTCLGHPLVTSGTRPPADNCSEECPETRASDILRFKVGKCIKKRTT